jgi:hypothetical protein
VLTIRTDEPRAVAVVDAIHTGAVEALRRLLHDTPGLATARVIGPSGGEGVCESGRSPGRCCTWWRIGRHTSRGSETVAVLVAAGAESTPGSPVHRPTGTPRPRCTGRPAAAAEVGDGTALRCRVASALRWSAATR